MQFGDVILNQQEITPGKKLRSDGGRTPLSCTQLLVWQQGESCSDAARLQALSFAWQGRAEDILGFQHLPKGEGDAQPPITNHGATLGQRLPRQKPQKGRKGSRKVGGCGGEGRAIRAAVSGHKAKVLY